MALILIGSTVCPLCKNVLAAGEAITGLPASDNIEHALYEYYDQGFHQACFDDWDKKEEVLKIIAEEKAAFENSEYYKEMNNGNGW